MRGHGCDREDEVLATIRSGRRDAEALAHLSGCPSCQEAVSVSAWMEEFSRMPIERPLPDPTEIWWKTRLIERWEAERRAAAPVEKMQRAEVTAGLIAFAVFLVWQWPAIERWFAQAGLPRMAIGAAPSNVPGFLSMLTAGAALLAVLAIVAVHALLTEE